jgi:hypothetical protein
MKYYQEPLFALFNLNSAFKRRLGFANDLMREDWVATWSHYDRLDDDDVVPCMYCPYEPLELEVQRAEYLATPLDNGVEVEVRVPYQGESYLWQFFPDKPDYFVRGEIFRGSLILVEEAQSEALARSRLESRTSTILSLIVRQKERIHEFENLVPSLLQMEAVRLRSSPLLDL